MATNETRYWRCKTCGSIKTSTEPFYILVCETHGAMDAVAVIPIVEHQRLLSLRKAVEDEMWWDVLGRKRQHSALATEITTYVRAALRRRMEEAK